ncbi:hypothetical protein SAMN05421740_102149 [Parapedobacter koreensis]|uniref:Uncharacterized protein n=1 Tax=Parapedobacter koreensis TaxID=332977 RepID=A0A1H7I7U2_9SPHI|nr:hypothetical protein SAMN05421740_102149 [Parapedobacter koreensis]
MPVIHVSWSKGISVFLTEAKGQDKFGKKSPARWVYFLSKTLCLLNTNLLCSRNETQYTPALYTNKKNVKHEENKH